MSSTINGVSNEFTNLRKREKQKLENEKFRTDYTTLGDCTLYMILSLVEDSIEKIDRNLKTIEFPQEINMNYKNF